MSSDALKKIISAMLLTCLTSNLDTKMEFCGTLLGNIEKFISMEKIDKNPNRTFLIRVYSDFYALIECMVLEASGAKLTSADIGIIRKKIMSTNIHIDASFDTAAAQVCAETMRQLGEIRLAQHNFGIAQNHFAHSLAGSADSYAAATQGINSCLNTAMNICIECALVGFNEKDWTKRTTSPAPAEVK